MKSKFILCLALVLSVCPAFALVGIYHVSPTNSDTPVSVRVAASDFGERFTVFYRTNKMTSDKFLLARLEIGSEDQQIASCDVEKIWTTNGVEFEFTVSAAYVTASRFTIIELGHFHDRPMGSAYCFWFYLRDFVTNSLSSGLRTNSSGITPDIIKALPTGIQSLRPGMTADQV